MKQNNSKPPFYLTFTPERLKEVLFAGMQATYGMGVEGSYEGVSKVEFAKRPQGSNNELTDVYIFEFPAKEEEKEEEENLLPTFLENLHELESVWINEININFPKTVEELSALDCEHHLYEDSSGWYFDLGDGWTFEVSGGDEFDYCLHTTFMERNYWFYLDGTQDDD